MSTTSRGRNLAPAAAALVLVALAGVGGAARAGDGGAALAGVDAPSATSTANAEVQAVLASGALPELSWTAIAPHGAALSDFYRERGAALAWTLAGRPTPQAQALIGALAAADAKGLTPEEYDGPAWAARATRLGAATSTDQELARFDVALTLCAMRLATDLHVGRVAARRVNYTPEPNGAHRDFANLLAQQLVGAPDPAAVLDSVEPTFPVYRRTLLALQNLRALDSQGEGAPFPRLGRRLEPGGSWSGTGALAVRLRALGDLPAAATSSEDGRYDGTLADAVRRYQARHGLKADGNLDAATLQQLSTPFARRVAQMRLTLERLRWLPQDYPIPPLVVNIPEFRLHAADARLGWALGMKVVVGRAWRRQTPVFGGELTQVIFQPFWHVPQDIARRELVPKFAKDPAALGRNHFQLVDRHGTVFAAALPTPEQLRQVSAGQLLVRQTPGSHNALGAVKFIIPNDHSIYLHGTPGARAFARTRRDLSHGCVRVEDPESLAVWVLHEQPGWDLQRVRAAMGPDGPPSQLVTLARPIPVLILYTTAVVLESGELTFFPDIYKLDARLQRSLDAESARRR
jgi:murein L,D-transpeptidase YcbB/YkuD